MQDFRIGLTTDIHDVDYTGTVRTSALLRYMQSAAQSQLTAGGLSYESLRAQDRVFLLSRIRAEFDRPLTAYEPLTAITYPCESRGYSFLRCYSLEQDGVPVARAASVWALLDVGKHSLVRVSDFPLGLTTLPPNRLTPEHIRLPETMREVGSYRVGYGDTDQNRHMNNTRYPDLYATFLPLDGYWIRAINISYLNEAPMGTELRVEIARESENDCYFRTTLSDGRINSAAQILLERR